MGDLIQFIPRPNPKRRDREAELANLAKEVMELALEPHGKVDIFDTAPCELPSVWPDFYHAPDKDPA